MRYLAELEGAQNVLESLAPCLQSDNVRLRKIDQRWVLESSVFNQCTTGQEVFPLADALLSRIHGVMAIYLGLHQKFSVASVLWLNSDGLPFRRSLRDSIRVHVFSAAGLRKLATLHGGEPLASALVYRAMTDERLCEVFSLVAERPLQWASIYDIIEFLGGIKEIVHAGWATKAEITRVRRTANYYRHLGKRNRNPLPPNPSTLAQAGAFASNLLKQWIATLLDEGAM